jgi:ribosomal protein L31E
MAERILTLNMRKYLVNQPRTKRLRKAIRYVRERVSHFTKIKEENVKISMQLNSVIFKKYSKSMPPLKLSVKIGTDTADVFPFSEKPVQKQEVKAKPKLLEKTTDQKPAAPQQKK